MTEIELFKEIVRATTKIPHERVPQALARVRELLAASPSAPAFERKERAGRDRMFRGGADRSGDESA